MFAVQAEGCAPIVRAFERGEETAEPWQDASTVAAGIRVPAAVGDFLILRAVRESGGAALAVNDDDILAARHHVASSEGTLLCPEGAATYVAWQQARDSGLLRRGARSVLFNCATGLKYPLADLSIRFA
jgi:threonine synthase